MSGTDHETPDDDAREARTLSATENADLCSGCVTCCTYITIEVDAPRAAWEYDQWIWALHHRGVQLYVEKPERWFVHFETACGHLQPTGRCAIHGRHPVLCREYDPRSCERRLPLADIRAWFRDGAELEGWLRRHRPGHWRKLEAYRLGGAVPAGGPALIPVESLLAPRRPAGTGERATVTARAAGRRSR